MSIHERLRRRELRPYQLDVPLLNVNVLLRFTEALSFVAQEPQDVLQGGKKESASALHRLGGGMAWDRVSTMRDEEYRGLFAGRNDTRTIAINVNPSKHASARRSSCFAHCPISQALSRPALVLRISTSTLRRTNLQEYLAGLRIQPTVEHHTQQRIEVEDLR